MGKTKRLNTSARGTCWYCHAVDVDHCPQCGTTREEREETRRFYASFVRHPAPDREGSDGR